MQGWVGRRLLTGGHDSCAAAGGGVREGAIRRQSQASCAFTRGPLVSDTRRGSLESNQERREHGNILMAGWRREGGGKD